MRLLRYRLALLLFLWTGLASAQVDTLRLATYNLLKFPFNNGTGRIPYFRTVINALDPDILVVQELESAEGLLTFVNEVMNAGRREVYQSAPYVDGYDTDNGLLYKPNKVSLRSMRRIRTNLRDISEYVIAASGLDFYVYSLHLKAGSGAYNENRRLAEANKLRLQLNNLPARTDIIVAGDFNMYRSSEPAFARLTESQNDNDGQLWDPIRATGTWNNNAAFATIHTQSTRTTVIDSGASGGLDDRFDMLLVSASLLSEGGMDFLPGTYNAFGNDGRHFNRSINTGTNKAVPDSVAEALYRASDHLPVYADFVIGDVSTVVSTALEARPSDFRLRQNYPNPFNAETAIAYSVPHQAHVSLRVYDLAGQLVRVLVDGQISPGEKRVFWDGRNGVGERVASGVYFYRLEAAQVSLIKKMILMQ